MLQHVAFVVYLKVKISGKKQKRRMTDVVTTRKIRIVRDEVPSRVALNALRSGRAISDNEFDVIYSDVARHLSESHWTPVVVALGVAKLLVRDHDSKVLDVGSGVGKFCQIGASVTPGTFVGVEQRAKFVEESRRVCLERNIARAHFIHGNAFDLDWSTYDAIYLFNPFYEHVEPLCRLDGELDLSAEIFASHIARVEEKLRSMPKGTRVATYHGFGGKMPKCYDSFFFCRHGGDYVRAWVKV